MLKLNVYSLTINILCITLYLNECDLYVIFMLYINPCLMYKKYYWYVLLIAATTCTSISVSAQSSFKPISLPLNINSVNEEYSGITMYNNRLYLEPQYGSRKETKLDSGFFIYSILADSIGRL
jgi:hypothetical protein